MACKGAFVLVEDVVVVVVVVVVWVVGVLVVTGRV